MVVVRDDFKNPRWEDVYPTLFLVNVVERFHEVCRHPGVNQLMAHVDLERVGRVTTQHAGLKRGLGFKACTTRDCGINDLHVGEFFIVHLEQIEQASCLSAGGPPGKDFEFLLHSHRRGFGGCFSGGRCRCAGCYQENGNDQKAKDLREQF